MLRLITELSAARTSCRHVHLFDRGLRIEGVSRGLQITFRTVFGGVIIAAGLNSPGFGFAPPANAKAIGSDLLTAFLYCGSAYIIATAIGEIIKLRKPPQTSSSPH